MVVRLTGHAKLRNTFMQPQHATPQWGPPHPLLSKANLKLRIHTAFSLPSSLFNLTIVCSASYKHVKMTSLSLLRQRETKINHQLYVIGVIMHDMSRLNLNAIKAPSIHV